MILNVYKEKDMTSRDVVNILNRHFNTKKIWHKGTHFPLEKGRNREKNNEKSTD